MDTTSSRGREATGEGRGGGGEMRRAEEDRGGGRGEERIEGAWWNSHIILQQLIAIRRASAIFSSFLSNSPDPPWNS